jgi:hypothetical protein
MACRKCGSGWTTIKGADVASCPHCCKQQRGRAKKAGRYTDPTEVKRCAECGGEFTATGLTEIAKKACCSADCQKTRRANAMRAHKRRYASEAFKSRNGDRGPVLPKRERPRCAMCGQECKSHNAKKYCSPKCFVDARSAGIQAWDRSKIEEAARNRPSNVCESPEAYATRAGMKDREAFLRNFERMRKSRMRKQARPPVAIAARWFAFFVRHIPKVLSCKLCGVQCIKPAYWKLPHCSLECARKDCTDAVCTCCTRPMKIHFMGGNVEARKAKPVCNRCVLNRHKKVCGDFRERCRRFGVAYDPKVTRPAVFVRDRYRCHICKKKTLVKYVVRGGRAHPRSPTVDHHPYPLSAGIKGHEWDNVRCACLKCNVRKGAAWSGQRLLFR